MSLQERIILEESSDLQDIMSTQNGRRLLWRVLSHCGVYKDIRTDCPREDARALGRRSVGLWLMHIIGAGDPEMLFEMMREAQIRDEEHQIILEQELREDDETEDETEDKTEKVDEGFNIDSFLS